MPLEKSYLIFIQINMAQKYLEDIIYHFDKPQARNHILKCLRTVTEKINFYII